MGAYLARQVYDESEDADLTDYSVEITDAEVEDEPNKATPPQPAGSFTFYHFLSIF